MLYSIIGILVIIFDQLVKYWVDENINYLNPSIELIPNVLSLVRVQNDGAAFSFLQGGGARIWFVALTAIFAILVVIALATNFISGRFGRWCLVFITAGGLSNMIDRVRFGYVIDMFKIELFDFAVFNVADIFITVFCIAFILYILFGGEKEKDRAVDAFDEDDYEYEEERRSSRTRSSRRSRKDDYEEEAEALPPRRTRSAAAKLEDEEEEPAPRRAARKQRKAAPSQPVEEDLPVEKPRRARNASRSDDDMFEEMFGTNQPTIVAPSRNSTQHRPATSTSDQAGTSPRRSATPQQADASRRNAAQPRRAASAPAERRQTVEPSADPFAEWEKANARVNASRRTSFEEEPVPVQKKAESAAADAFSDFTEPASKPAARRSAPASQPAASAAKPAPVQTQAPSDDEFDLDSILNEFK